MSDRLEEIKEELVMNVKLKIEDVNWLIQQAERVELLEELLTQVQYDREMAKNNAEEKIRYKQALEFYADKNNYVVDPSELELPEDIIDAVPPIVDERGKMARKALEG